MKKRKKYLITFLLILLIVFVYSALFLQIINDQKIAWRVKVGNFTIGLLSPTAAKEELQKKWDEFSRQEIVLDYQDKEWRVNLADLGFEMDCQSIVAQAEQIGRQSNLTAGLKDQFLAAFGRYNLEPVYQINSDKFQQKTTEIFSNIENPAQNATLVYNDELGEFFLVHSTEGTAVDRKKLIDDLSQRVKTFSSGPILLNIVHDYPTVENNEVQLAKEQSNRIITSQPYYLKFNDDYWTINKDILLDWIEFKLIKENGSNNEILGFSLSKDKIRNYLQKIARNIDRPATNAKLKIESDVLLPSGKRAVEFSSAKEGFEVKLDQTFDQFFQNISSQPAVKTTEIIADVSYPKISLEETNNFGINELIGQGISNFSGSPKNRKHNISGGVEKFSGVILAPGEEFSFNAILDDSGPEAGYLPELVIKNNQTIPEYGGGLCQVSTTLFRAAIYSGLEITARTPHAFPVVYYNPQGFDATVYDPKPDLKFLNDTPGYLLIEGIIEGNQITFNFYGTKTNQEVKIIGPDTLEKKEDGSMKTVLTQEVYKNGELFYRRSFYSNYDSPAKYGH
ncbi:VanW family protein [Patescibacteria group bacterium]|nr:VanW family protein [Patescibacteria group bacterium]